MIRNLVVSIWILSLTLLAAYLGATVQFHSTASSSSAGEEGPATIALKSLTVPVIANGAMQGYVLATMTLSVKGPLLKKLPQPADLVLTDAVFKTLYAEEQVDFKNMTKQDLDKLTKIVVESVNARMGVPLVENVFIQELHFLSKQELAAGGGGGSGTEASHH